MNFGFLLNPRILESSNPSAHRHVIFTLHSKYGYVKKIFMVDTITHGLIGAFLSRLGFRQKEGKIAATVMVLASILPDFDMILNFWGDEITYKNHRGFTHSVFGAIAISLILALIFYFLSSYKRLFHLFLFTLILLLEREILRH